MATFIGIRSVDGGHELLRGHLEATVAVDSPNRSVGTPHLGPDRRRHREAHGAEASGVHPGVRVIEAPVLAGPHLVLADAGHDRRVGRAGISDRLDDGLRLQQFALGLRLVEQREPGPVVVQVCPPLRTVRLRLAARYQHAHELFDHEPAVTDYRHVRAADFAELGGIDVNMDDFCAGSEVADLTGNPVVEARSEGNRGDRLPAWPLWPCNCRASRACRGIGGGCRGTTLGP